MKLDRKQLLQQNQNHLSKQRNDVFKHLVIVIGILIDLFVPDIPEDLDLKIKREQFIARQTLADGSDNQDKTTEAEENERHNL